MVIIQLFLIIAVFCAEQITSTQMWSTTSRTPLTQLELSRMLFRAGAVTNHSVASIFSSVDRKHFVPQSYKDLAYHDCPLPIGAGQTISAPHMHIHALEILYPVLQSASGKRNFRALDVGCGSGYFSALLATTAPQANIFGVDCFPILVDLSKENCRKLGGDATKVKFSVGDGWKGLPTEAPFDVIHVGAAATSIPVSLLQQLNTGGRMVIPVGPAGGAQNLMIIDRIRADKERPESDGSQLRSDIDMSCFQIEEAAVVAFVPLIRYPDDEVNTTRGVW